MTRFIRRRLLLRAVGSCWMKGWFPLKEKKEKKERKEGRKKYTFWFQTAADFLVTAYQLVVNKRVVPCALDGYDFLLQISAAVLEDVSPRGRCYCFVVIQQTETRLSHYAPGPFFPGHLLSYFNFSPLCLSTSIHFSLKTFLWGVFWVLIFFYIEA